MLKISAVSSSVAVNVVFFIRTSPFRRDLLRRTQHKPRSPGLKPRLPEENEGIYVPTIIFVNFAFLVNVFCRNQEKGPPVQNVLEPEDTLIVKILLNRENPALFS